MGFTFSLDRPSTQGKQAQRFTDFGVRRMLTTALAVGVTLMFVAYLVIALNWYNRTFFGAVVSHTMVVTASRPTGGDTWNALAAGLRARDYIVSINGQVLLDENNPRDFWSARTSFERIMSGLVPGAPLTVQVVQPDGTQRSVTYITQTFPNGDFLFYFIIPYVSGGITLAAAWLILLRRSHQYGALFRGDGCATDGDVDGRGVR